MINVLAQQNSQASLKLIGPRDVYIKPNLQGITAADFTKFREGAARGRAAALAVADKLRQYAVPERDYVAWTTRLRAALPPLPRVDVIQIAPLQHVNPENVAKHLEQRPGQQLDTHLLERDLARIYGDGDFESVDYLMHVAPGRNTLRINPLEKSWGPDYLRFGVSVEAGDKQNDFAVRGAYHRKWINAYGAEWLSGAQLGERSNVFTDFYQPLDPRQRFFVEPGIALSRDRLRVYQDDQRIAEYILRQTRAFLYGGVNFGVVGQARLGWLYRKLDTSIETGPPTLPTGKVTLRGYSALLDLDQTDRVFFPTRGWFAGANYFRSPDRGYSRLGVDLRAIHSWDPYVVNARYYFLKRFDGKLPLADAGGLGGFLTLSGYARNQILAGDIRFFSVRGEKIIGRMPLGLSGDLRAGVSLEFGRARERFTETHVEGWQQAASLYLGGDTPLGPLYLGYGYAKGGHHSIYLFLGLP